jgi:mRNA-degrading endonuclease toxin of MazEF toxin-antitoxin module
VTGRYWKPAPKLADIVQCRFPEEVGKPGPKERPALVLQIEQAADDPDGYVVVVAYATSQHTDRVFPGEFVITPGPKTGLTKATKFDLVNHHALPFNDEWFAAAVGRTPPHPTRGRLDLKNVAIKRRLHAALSEAKALRATSKK